MGVFVDEISCTFYHFPLITLFRTPVCTSQAKKKNIAI